MKITDYFTFGKYKNLSIEQIFLGSNDLPFSLFKDYFCQNLSSSYFLSNLKISELELIEKLRLTVTNGYFLICSGHDNHDYTTALSTIFRNKDTVAERKKGFVPLNDFIYSKVNDTLDYKSVKLSAAPEYIEWAIKSHSNFFIDQNDIDFIQGSKCHKYIGLTVRRIDNNVYSFTPLYHSPFYRFEEETLRANLMKMRKAFEASTRGDINNSTDHNFGFYKGSYAQDVEGWSDEEIRDAFGGEPDAYWNID